MIHPPIILPDDPREALRHISSYLVTVRAGSDRKHYELRGPEGLGKEHVGYWQTRDWIEGLIELARESERVADGKPASSIETVRDVSTSLNMTKKEGAAL